MFGIQVKRVKKGEPGSKEVTKDVNGRMIMESGAVRRAEYFEKVFLLCECRR